MGVTYTITDGSATTTDNDYSTTLATGTLSWANGDSSDKNIPITVNGDTIVELDETINITLSSPTGGATITGTNPSTLTIQNDDTDIAVAISPSSVVEDDVTDPALVYTFTRTGVTTGAITVNFSVGGTASFPADYAQIGASAFGPTSGTVEFGDGIITATVTIDPVTEAIYEPDETVILTVTPGSAYEPADSPNHSASGTITNNDAPPTLSIGDRIANEGTTGPATTTNFAFTVTRTGGTEVTATVDFATADGATNPATGGGACGGSVDYVSQSGSLTFLPNESTKTITILVCRDSNVEANETFFVDLDNASEATISDSQARGTIQNDDSPGTSLTVNSTNDVNDGTCNSTHCSLREAIIAASGSFDPNAIGISFAIPANDPRSLLLCGRQCYRSGNE